MSSSEIFPFLSTSALCLRIGGLLLASALGWAPRGAGPRARGGLRSRVSRARTPCLGRFPSASRFQRGVKRTAQCLFMFHTKNTNAGMDDFSASESHLDLIILSCIFCLLQVDHFIIIQFC